MWAMHDWGMWVSGSGGRGKQWLCNCFASSSENIGEDGSGGRRGGGGKREVAASVVQRRKRTFSGDHFRKRVK